MKTILFIVNHNITIYQFRRELVERLVARGYAVTAALPVIPETEKLKRLGCRVIDVPVERRGTNPAHDFKLMLKYCAILKREKPDLVLTYTIKPNIYGGMACQLLNIPYFCTITGLGTAVEGGGLLRRISLFLYRIGLRKARKVFFQNGQNRRVFREARIRGGESRLLPGSGVNLREYEDIPYPGEDAAVEFLFISRVMKAKGIEEFIETARAVKSRYPCTVFHILGFCEDDYQETLEELTRSGVLSYEGMQEDIRPFMKRCQCLIHPSYHEGMSNVCLEAAASGRAVIASDISGCREAVEEGVTGFLAKPQSAGSLTRAVVRYLGLSYEERKRMGEKGREKMRKEFDREKVVSAYMEEIENELIRKNS